MSKTYPLHLFFSLLLLFFITFIQAQDFEWAGNLGGPGIEYGRSVCVDDSAFIYVTGFFQDTADFEMGSGTTNLVSAGGFDVFILKIDSASNLIWARNIGGTGNEFGYTIDTDANGNIYVAGRFEGTADMNPSLNTFTVTSAGGPDMFVTKLDASGNFVWSSSMGGTATDQINSMKVDPLGNVYASGGFNGTTDFDPDTSTYNLSSMGAEDMFVLKLDSSGKLLWANTFGSTGNERSYSLAIDNNTNIFTTGVYSNTVDFDPGTGVANLVSNGNFDMYILKLDSSGNYLWAKSMGTNSHDFGYGISTDIFGNVITTGYFQNTVDFDPGLGSSPLTSNGNYDIFIQKMDSSGNFQWARSMGGAGDDRGYSVATDEVGSVYLTGYFLGATDFDHSSSSHIVTPVGNADFYVHKTDSAGNYLWVAPIGGANHDFGLALDVDSEGSIYTTGNFEGQADFDPDPSTTYNLTPFAGSDVHLLKLKQCSSYEQLVASSCATFISPSGKYTWNSTGLYMDTLINSVGCDSVISVDLTILPEYLVQVDTSICAGDSIILAGSYRKSSGNYTDSLQSFDGCDSLITTQLRVIQIDTSISFTMKALTANHSGASYQWLNCDSSFQQIAGATSQTFVTSIDGNYAVEITDSGCVDTSMCYFVMSVGFKEFSTANFFDIYPNPTNSVLNIQFGKKHDQLNIAIYSLDGKKLYSFQNKGTQHIQLDINELPTGVYFIRINTKDGSYSEKVIKQ